MSLWKMLDIVSKILLSLLRSIRCSNGSLKVGHIIRMKVWRLGMRCCFLQCEKPTIKKLTFKIWIYSRWWQTSHDLLISYLLLLLSIGLAIMKWFSDIQTFDFTSIFSCNINCFEGECFSEILRSYQIYLQEKNV